MSLTVLVMAPTLSARGIDRLRTARCRILFTDGGEPEIDRLLASEPIDAAISRALNLSGAAIESCPTLRVISKHGAGVDNIDIAAATRRGVPVFFTPGANAQSVAELAVGLALAVARKIPTHGRFLHDGRWTNNLSIDSIQLLGKTLGVVGLGEIGCRVARLGQAFGMQVIGFDPLVRDPPVETVAALEDLLPLADVLTLHCPLTQRTRGMIGVAEIARLRKSAIIINTARGGLIDEFALAAALIGRRIFGAALDTFAVEPLSPDSPLRDIPNLILTPHIGASTVEALDAMAVAAVDNLLDYLGGKPMARSICCNPITLGDNKMALTR